MLGGVGIGEIPGHQLLLILFNYNSATALASGGSKV